MSLDNATNSEWEALKHPTGCDNTVKTAGIGGIGQPSVCPICGRCPTCGRGGNWYPSTPISPIYCQGTSPVSSDLPVPRNFS